MRLFEKLSGRTDPYVSLQSAEPTPIVSAPMEIVDSGGQVRLTCVDKVACTDGMLVVLGWTDASSLRIELAGQRLSVIRHKREDVALDRNLDVAADHGFAATVNLASGLSCPNRVVLTITLANCAPYLLSVANVADGLEEYEALRVPRSYAEEVRQVALLPVGSPAWRRALDLLPKIKSAPVGIQGYLEAVFASPEGGLVAVGWALHPSDISIWIEDEFGAAKSLSSGFRRRRGDVAAAFAGLPWADMESAFVLHLPDMESTASLSLRAATPEGVVTLAAGVLPELLPAAPALAAQKLFGIETEEHLFHQRVPLVDLPVLAPLIAGWHPQDSDTNVDVIEFGRAPEAPFVSIIIPLYRRFDFIEHQLLEFLRDPDVLARAEIVYVIDDPTIVDAVITEVNFLQGLYGIPVRLIAGGRNRGFSGANNVGAANARGNYLLFMNSDVIPIAPGWLAEMLKGFEVDNVGIVGAQLLFADGGVQHAGMEFHFLDRFGIWSNQHPGAGLPPVDANTAIRAVPAVTGACLMIPRDLFSLVGGWDTGYLIGDFEDSDLCLAVRAARRQVVLQPSAVLTHLERQSFTGVSGGYFRVRMTILNAVRHQMRWEKQISAPVDAAPVDDKPVATSRSKRAITLVGESKSEAA